MQPRGTLLQPSRATKHTYGAAGFSQGSPLRYKKKAPPQ